MGRKEGLNNLYKMLRSHFKGGRTEPQHVVKDIKGHILTNRAEVLNRYREGMMAKTNVGVDTGVAGERDAKREGAVRSLEEFVRRQH